MINLLFFFYSIANLQIIQIATNIHNQNTKYCV